MAVTALALVWANSPWAETYLSTWNTPFTIGIGNFGLSKPILLWINDGLMAIFFFVVGLEIKREILTGELSSFRSAAFPVVAALGGMAVPALIYFYLNSNQEGAGGWGIPMATDIAFALGILTLLGDRVNVSLKLFLVAFAIVDDIGAVLVIALFYTSDINFLSLWFGIGLFGILLVLSALKSRKIWFFIILGIIMWVAFLLSGVHATIAGILLALTIPARSKISEEQFISYTQHVITDLEALQAATLLQQPEDDDEMQGHFQDALQTVETNCKAALSPLRRLEHALHPWVAFAIMPIFALSNAGIRIDAGLLDDFRDPVVLGIMLGLVLGKPVGILLFTWLATLTGVTAKPGNISWLHVAGAGLLGGIGFTMSIFIANLAFTNSNLLPLAKFGILAASLIAGTIGYLLLRFTYKSSAKI
ncbi:Na+/H+ antiporter NhaA [Pontibacter sp. BT213]|uniref:Na(+)/H(+) antiporter NhaA n=2 Tax=Pontibacter fetidus TaxID=2700082 RepID=A0A6B2H219_9BACT|nr:Na+/H+ antiporter NhaA [Pontibacter fetidus]